MKMMTIWMKMTTLKLSLHQNPKGTSKKSKAEDDDDDDDAPEELDDWEKPKKKTVGIRISMNLICQNLKQKKKSSSGTVVAVQKESFRR